MLQFVWGLAIIWNTSIILKDELDSFFVTLIDLSHHKIVEYVERVRLGNSVLK